MREQVFLCVYASVCECNFFYEVIKVDGVYAYNYFCNVIFRMGFQMLIFKEEMFRYRDEASLNRF